MIRKLGAALERFFRAVTPDPFVLAVLLTALTGLLALVMTDASFSTVLASWQAELIWDPLLGKPPSGFWGLLAFAMQMCLVLVTGHALASAPLVRKVIDRLVELPSSARAAGAMVAFVAIGAGLLNWGLGLVVGALIARDTGLAMRRKGVPVHYPLLAAAGYAGMMTWHGGFSGSAPLKVTKEADLVRFLGEDLAREVGTAPITETILGGMNLFVSGGLLLLVPLLVFFMMPKGEEVTGVDAFPVAETPAEDEEPARTFPEKLARSPVTLALLLLPLAAALWKYFGKYGVARLDPNAVNLTLFFVGLLLHGNLHRYGQAVQRAVSGCAGIILQFPLYAGIMGIMAGTGLAAIFAGWSAAAGSGAAYKVLTFTTAGLINLFVPSGGGQWAIQAKIAAQGALAAGLPFSTAVMAVAYGDQWTNMLQPFWALPLLGITGVRARDIIGYTATIMLISGVWILAGLLLFG